MSKNDKDETNYLALGIGLGLPFGFLIGLLVLDNPILGLSFGTLIGAGIGGLIQSNKIKSNKQG